MWVTSGRAGLPWPTCPLAMLTPCYFVKMIHVIDYIQPHWWKAQWVWGQHKTPSLILRASPISVTFQAQQKAISETLQLAIATLYAATLLIVLWIGHCWCSTDWGPCPTQESHPDALGPCCSHTQHKHYFTQPNFNASCFWSINAMVTKCMYKQNS